MTPFTARKILTSQTVGERLAKIRQGSNLALADAAHQIGIKRVYLEAIEAGLYNELPGDIYALEFIKSYARWLRLDPAALARAYLKERAEQSLRPEKLLKPRPGWGGPSRPLAKIAAWALAGVVIFYALSRTASVLRPPGLEVLSPAVYYTAADGRVLLSGQTTPSSRLFVNQQEITLDESGAFNEIFYLPPGLTLLQIAARDQYGRETMAYRTIRVPERGQARLLAPERSDGGQVAGASTTKEKF